VVKVKVHGTWRLPFNNFVDVVNKVIDKDGISLLRHILFVLIGCPLCRSHPLGSVFLHQKVSSLYFVT